MITEKDKKKLEKFLSLEALSPNQLLFSSELDPSKDFCNFNFDDLFLSKINLSGYNLEGASFKNTILNGANFTDANLENAVFENSNLRRSNFTGANLEGSNFKNVSLYKTKGNEVFDLLSNKDIAEDLGAVLIYRR